MIGRSAQRIIAVAIPVAAGVVVIAVLMPLSPPYDLDVFLTAARALVHGGALYPPPGSAAVYSGSAFVYPAFSAAAFVPIALLSRDAATATFFALSVGALGAACLVQTRDPVRTMLVLGSSFVITGLQLGALSPLLAAGALCLWRLRDRPRVLAVVAAPVLAAKLFLIALLAWLVLARRWAALAGAAGLTAALVGAGFVLGPLGPGGYLHLLSALGAHEASAGFGLIGALRRSGVAQTPAELVAVAAAAALMFGAHRHHAHHGDERVLFCAALTSCLAVSPVVWSHYLVLLLLVPLVLELPRRWLVVLTALSWIAAPAHGIRIGDDELAALRPALWVLVAVVLVGTYGVTERTRAGGRSY